MRLCTGADGLYYGSWLCSMHIGYACGMKEEREG